MAGNTYAMAAIYGDGTDEDKRHRRSRTSYLEYHYTAKHLEGLISKHDRLLEVGCATGYFGFHFADQFREYVGVDLHPPHIERFRKKIEAHKMDHLSCRVGDATDLGMFEEGSFDLVFCLGPMYHLPARERETAFAECARVCKQDGILAFAYMNRVGVYTGACLLGGLDGHYPNARANQLILEENRDDARPDSFFYTMPEEIEAVAARHGLEKIKNLGTDFSIAMRLVDRMADDRFELMKPLYDQMTRYESCTGMSNHALLICRKSVASL